MDVCKGYPSYYNVLGVGMESSDEEIRRAYHKLAMQWHPDKWTRNPSLVGEAKQKFQEIQEAYSVLSDRGRRTLYDAGLYDPYEEEEEEEDEVERFTDFVQEMVSMMKDAKKEEKSCSIEELQGMFWEMAKDFEVPFPQWNGNSNNNSNSNSNSSNFEQQITPEWLYGSSNIWESGGGGGQYSWEPNMMFQGNPHFTNSQAQDCGAYHFCR